jgi:CheY-like chemotaxis protein
MRSVIDGLSALAPFVSAVAWPIVVVVVAALFRRPLQGLLSGEQVALSMAGVSITSQRSAEAVRMLVRANAKHPGRTLLFWRAASQVHVISQAVERLGHQPRLLWVDDLPSNNRFEVGALRSLGISVNQVTSTQQALTETAQSRYDVVVTDMGRPPHADAGYQLIEALRRQRCAIPVAIYASSRSKEHFNQSIASGAVGCTNTASELFRMVLVAIEQIEAHQKPDMPRRPARLAGRRLSVASR